MTRFMHIFENVASQRIYYTICVVIVANWPGIRGIREIHNLSELMEIKTLWSRPALEDM